MILTDQNDFGDEEVPKIYEPSNVPTPASTNLINAHAEDKEKLLPVSVSHQDANLTQGALLKSSSQIADEDGAKSIVTAHQVANISSFLSKDNFLCTSPSSSLCNKDTLTSTANSSKHIRRLNTKIKPRVCTTKSK